MTPARGPALVVAAALSLALAACASAPAKPAHAAPAPSPATGGAPWPAPDDPLALAVKAGLQPEVKETLVNHVHSHLDVFVNGRPVQVPAGVGINIADPGVHHDTDPSGDVYGGIQGCARPCISPLHTHDTSGVLHTESATSERNTLGQFFTEWDVRLDRRCVGGYCKPDSIAVYVDGDRFSGNPAGIRLEDHTEIAIVIGTPPKKIPSTGDFSRA